MERNEPSRVVSFARAGLAVLNTPFMFWAMSSGNTWHFGDRYCRVAQFISPCAISASVFTYVAIAVDRCAPPLLSSRLLPFTSTPLHSTSILDSLDALCVCVSE